MTTKSEIPIRRLHLRETKNQENTKSQEASITGAQENVATPDARKGIFDTTDLGCGIFIGNSGNPKQCGENIGSIEDYYSDYVSPEMIIYCKICEGSLKEHQRLKAEVEKVIDEFWFIEYVDFENKSFKGGRCREELKNKLGLK